MRIFFLIVLFWIILSLFYNCNNKNNEIKTIKHCEVLYNSERFHKIIKQILEHPSDSLLFCYGDLTNYDTLKYIYKNRNYSSLWLTDENSITVIDSILTFFRNSKFHGLKTEWYYSSLLAHKLNQIKSVKNNCDSIDLLFAETEIILTNSLIDYCNHLSYGFIDPLLVYENSFSIPLKQKDSLLLNKILKPSDILVFLNNIQPKGYEYVKLQNELSEMFILTWDSIPLPDTPKIALNDTNKVLKKIAERLKITHELPADYNPDSISAYDTTLEKAIIKFQLYHGLLADGIIGYNTINQLNVSSYDRAMQIAANLERLRWSNLVYTGKHFNINIPEFMLYAYNCDTFKFALKVCVGERKPKNYNDRMKKYLKTHRILDRPPNHETPVFSSKISHLVLNPDWLVPVNIVQKELYFSFIKDPFYLKDHDYKVYLNNVEVNPDSIQWKKYRVDHIPFRIKQNPGEINALGRIKFVFYNPYDVFLHDTPSKNNFNRSGRAVSHGCIRVEKPLKLVDFLLNENSRFDIDDIRMAIGMEPEKIKEKDKYNLKVRKAYKEKMEEYKKIKELLDKDSLTLETKRIFLKKPAAIVVSYSTAFIDTNGFLQFREDLYNRDMPIINKLKEVSLKNKKIR